MPSEAQIEQFIHTRNELKTEIKKLYGLKSSIFNSNIYPIMINKGGGEYIKLNSGRYELSQELKQAIQDDIQATIDTVIQELEEHDGKMTIT
jgi:hypothetical protein